ncbi:hypothetical protein MBLNU230_g1057t1 [Neophaeotheca triangularis]
MSSRLLSTTIGRLAQVSRQLSSQQNATRQQLRMASTAGTMHKLNTGASIPALGFGTWQDKEAQEEAVLTALKCGYRHIDTARIYGTEKAVGAAIRKAGIPRSELFITTKLWNNEHAPSSVEPALDASLADLGLDYVDLYLMHWPSPFQEGGAPIPKDANNKTLPGTTDYTTTYLAMEKLQHSGKTRAIGVSNFSLPEMETLLANTNIVPAAHQLELHPYLAQPAFHQWHQTHNIHLTQYSPFGNSNPIYTKGATLANLISDPTLLEIGRKYGKSGAQVALAWGIAHGRSVIPKSKTQSRIRENLEGDFVLEPADVRVLDGLDRRLRFNDPSGAFGWDFYRGLDGKE